MYKIFLATGEAIWTGLATPHTPQHMSILWCLFDMAIVELPRIYSVTSSKITIWPPTYACDPWNYTKLSVSRVFSKMDWANIISNICCMYNILYIPGNSQECEFHACLLRKKKTIKRQTCYSPGRLRYMYTWSYIVTSLCYGISSISPSASNHRIMIRCKLASRGKSFDGIREVE